MIEEKLIPKDDLGNVEVSKDEQSWATYGAHDPAIIKDGDWYYVFSTDTGGRDNFKAGIQIRKSKDLINWEWVGRAFTDGVPQEAYQWSGAEGLWAPEVVKMNDIYYMYYSASQFGKTQSFIGVATSKKIEGPYQDQGLVYRSKQGEDGPNAIDPNIIFDRDHQPWLVYGSFFGGIYINKVNPKTGKFISYGRGTLIAKRNTTVDRAIEGPYIVYNPDSDYYYLFVSYDSLFANYNIRVARSKVITGPYYDYNGLEMTDIESPQADVGMKVLGGYKFKDHPGWVAPGHNSILKDGSNYFICHHARASENKHWHYLHIRKVIWTDEAWPLVSPERFAGEDETTLEPQQLSGKWEFIEIDKQNNDQDVSIEVNVGNDTDKVYFINGSNQNSFTLRKNNQQIIGKVNYGWDWERWVKTIIFVGHNNQGIVTIGKKIV